MLLSSTNQFWKAEDLTGLPRREASRLLAELTKAGELTRERRGLYWRGTQTPLGMSPPGPESLVFELCGKTGVGLCGLSAANKLGLSTQIPRRAHYAVPGVAPKDSGGVKFTSRCGRTGRLTAQLNPTDVAFLEVLEAFEEAVETTADEGFEKLRKMLTNDTAMAKRLTLAAETEPAKVRTRLAALLQSAGYEKLSREIPAAVARSRKTARAGFATAQAAGGGRLPSKPGRKVKQTDDAFL